MLPKLQPRYVATVSRQQDRWMVSYLDVLTIILIFFLVIAARTFDVPARGPASRVSARASAADRDPALSRAESLFSERGLDPKRDARGLVVSFPQTVLFEPGADTLNPRALETLAQIASVLRVIPNEVRLTGHADATPIRSRRFHNNWELAIARSQAILEILSTRYGISEKRLSLASYGDWRPAATNETLAPCRDQRNTRWPGIQQARRIRNHRPGPRR